MLGVGYVKFSPSDYKFFKGGDVIDVIVLVPINNGVYAKASVDWEKNDSDGVLVTETP